MLSGRRLGTLNSKKRGLKITRGKKGSVHLTSVLENVPVIADMSVPAHLCGCCCACCRVRVGEQCRGKDIARITLSNIAPPAAANPLFSILYFTNSSYHICSCSVVFDDRPMPKLPASRYAALSLPPVCLYCITPVVAHIQRLNCALTSVVAVAVKSVLLVPSDEVR